MKTWILPFLLCSQFLFAQGEKKKLISSTAVGLQFAGSIGLLSVGYYKQAANKKIEMGLLYGYTPAFAGGEVHSLALKFSYIPFRIKVNPSFQIEPLQAGVFVSQHFAKNLSINWSDKYVPGYYWWTNSTRFHVFLGVQTSYVLNDSFIKKISLYFETNTNDLYFYSYSGNQNTKSLDLDDIFFFGIGSKLYF